jgi:hypothetical protein
MRKSAAIFLFDQLRRIFAAKSPGRGRSQQRVESVAVKIERLFDYPLITVVAKSSTKSFR